MPAVTEAFSDRRTAAAAQSFHISQKTGVACRVILKCGCTYIKNLLWHLDHNTAHPRGNWVHRAKDDLPRSTGQSADDIRANPYAFVVVRDPVDRFVSLYFDKVMRERKVGDGRLRRVLLEARAIDPAARNVAAHRQNCLATIDWIGRNLSGKTAQATNLHWTRQVTILRQIAALQPKVLTLNSLNPQLRYLLSAHIPDIARHQDGAKWRNRSPRPVAQEDLCDPELTAAIHKVYTRDAALWTVADVIWAGIDMTKPDAASIPVLGRDIDPDA